MALGCGVILNVCILLQVVLLSAEVVAQFDNCTGYTELIGDGNCDSVNNNAACNYDGGDCCACTCVDGPEHSCGPLFFYDCQDPDAADLLYACQETPVTTVSCSEDTPREWVVEETATAAILAENVSCSGGIFYVEWRGHVVVDRTIHIGLGTTLHITGVGETEEEAAVMDGSQAVPLITAVNASLHMSNILLANGRGGLGGAAVVSGSNVSFDHTSFSGNSATYCGGALYVVDSSVVSLAGVTNFTSNAADEDGGAVYVNGDSILSWNGETAFLHNAVPDFCNGGALYVAENSTVSWGAETLFFNNSGGDGGALHVTFDSAVSWTAPTTFSQNKNLGLFGGGALYVSHSSVFWDGNTTFLSNDGTLYGGAVYAENANLSWEGETSFLYNRCGDSGGAVYAGRFASVSWAGSTRFEGNSAFRGGAMCGEEISTVSANNSNTVFSSNAADIGGALAVLNGASVSLAAQTEFSHNVANRSGGALFIGKLGTYQYRENVVSWDGETTFFNNSALTGNGGALFVELDSILTWTGQTKLRSNSANSDGGAVGSSAADTDDYPSTLFINGTTSFLDNSCGASGGGMAVLSGLSVVIATDDITFRRNDAGVAGGAMLVSGVGIGPIFVGVSFVDNYAEQGGAVYAVGSGTTVSKGDDDVLVPNPTTFNRCKFVGNTAVATGGAIESGASTDTISNTFFGNNTSGVGGALRLGGKTSLSNCTFVNNTSNEDSGPAISNIGYISKMSLISFFDNTFDCGPGTFLDFNSSANLFEVVCSGCDTACSACEFKGDTPQCIGQLEHSTSIGGQVTLQDLSIAPGYWRATKTSDEVLACYNANACLGGVTGALDYCEDGYEGPYCSVCIGGYTRSLGVVCNECFADSLGIAITVVLLLLIMVAIAAALSYALVENANAAHTGFVDRVMRFIPLQSIKIVIVVWQIVTQFSWVANLTYPDVYQTFLDGVNVLNLDISWVFSIDCIMSVDFHDRLLAATIGPIVCIAILRASYTVAVRWNRGSEAALRSVRYKHLSMVLFLTFLVYSPVSSVLFQMFSCDELDDGGTYLRADYRIECNSRKHKALQIFSGFMIVLYTLGIPLVYIALLYKKRHLLGDEQRREDDILVKSTSDLWKPYKPGRFYYEVIECGRRVLLSGVVVFIYPDTAAQVAVTLAMAVFFMILSEILAPYESAFDAWVNRMGHVIVFGSMYVALLFKLDVSEEGQRGQKLLEITLVSANVCMILVVAAEAVALTCAFRHEEIESSRLQKVRPNMEDLET